MILSGWRELAPGALIQKAGNAVEYRTGAWRAERPVVDMAKCTHCMLCWLFCPEGTILTALGRFEGFDLEHCKGCGICAVECPPKAIEMVSEAESLKGNVG